MCLQFSEDPKCEVCKITKTIRSHRPDGRRDRIHLPQKFGDARTAEHKVLKEGNEPRLSLRSRGTAPSFVLGPQVTQRKKKTAQDTIKSFQKLVPPGQKPRIIQTDSSLVFFRPCEDPTEPEEQRYLL